MDTDQPPERDRRSFTINDERKSDESEKKIYLFNFSLPLSLMSYQISLNILFLRRKTFIVGEINKIESQITFRNCENLVEQDIIVNCYFRYYC